MNFFSDEVRRNPYPLYEQVRSKSPLLYDPASKLWMIFDYDGVKQALHDHEAFSSRHGPAEWMIFLDPPRHSKIRALLSLAFTPRSVVSLEPRIRELARELLSKKTKTGAMDVAADFAVPLPMMVIAAMLGVPTMDMPRFTRWNDIILKMSLTVPGAADTAMVMSEFDAVTVEMNEYLTGWLEARRTSPQDDLLTRLVQAEVDGQRLSQVEILGFFQLLLLAGSETTTNLINNAVLAFMEHPDQLAQLRAAPQLLPSAIEEVLRYHSPLAWMFRLTRREVEMHGQKIPASCVVLVMMASANRDPKQFPEPHRFDIRREPNTHLAFGHGIHFCLGAALARLEAKVALTEFLDRVSHFEPATPDPWQPRPGLHVQGPVRLPIRCSFHEPP